MSDFIESVDDMIARDFARWTMVRLDNKPLREETLYQLIRASIAHARSQVEGRKIGKMTFDEAMKVVRSGHVIVTRPSWDIFCGVREDESYLNGERVKRLQYCALDNCNGIWSGDGWPYEPSDEDRAATDWMLYQAPQENWVELDF